MQRQTPTRDALKGALVHLLQKKTFESITISDLCRTAGINRTTFYLHYIDKYDFVEQQKEETLAKFSEILHSTKDSKEALLLTLNYFYEDGNFFKVISQSSFANFSQTIKDYIKTIIEQDSDAEYFILQYYKNIPEIYAKELFVSSIESIIIFWMTNDFPESPQEILAILLKIPAFQWWTNENLK